MEYDFYAQMISPIILLTKCAGYVKQIAEKCAIFLNNVIDAGLDYLKGHKNLLLVIVVYVGSVALALLYSCVEQIPVSVLELNTFVFGFFSIVIVHLLHKQNYSGFTFIVTPVRSLKDAANFTLISLILWKIFYLYFLAHGIEESVFNFYLFAVTVEFACLMVFYVYNARMFVLVFRRMLLGSQFGPSLVDVALFALLLVLWLTVFRTTFFAVMWKYYYALLGYFIPKSISQAWLEFSKMARNYGIALAGIGTLLTGGAQAVSVYRDTVNLPSQPSASSSLPDPAKVPISNAKTDFGTFASQGLTRESVLCIYSYEIHFLKLYSVT